LLWAVEFVVDKRTKNPFPPEQAFSSRVGQAALQRGLLVYPMQGSIDGIAGDHILIAPPAVISKEQIHWSVEQLRDAIETSVAN
jgi:adenosylmethionine-8-amino-7-oxononanoate aminotransferase